MDQDKIVQDLFRSVELIAEKKISELDAPQVIVGTIIEDLIIVMLIVYHI